MAKKVNVPEGIITIPELAEILGVTAQSVRNKLSNGWKDIPVERFKLGRMGQKPRGVGFKKDDVKKYCKQRGIDIGIL